MSLFKRIRKFKPPKNNIYVSTNIRIYALQYMLFDKEEINTFCFTNGRCLFLNDLHGNYTTCTVKYTFHHIIDGPSLKNFLPIIWRYIPHFVNYILVNIRLLRHTLYNLHICRKYKYLENDIRYWVPRTPFLQSY